MNKRTIKRFLIGTAGATVLLLGIVMIVLPGPAIVFIPAGLAILATEFAWAKRWLEKVKVTALRA
jgi:tellurite resistance protein TerC